MHKNKWFPGILTEKEAAVMVKVGMYAICNLLFPPFFFPLHVICQPVARTQICLTGLYGTLCFSYILS